MRTRPAYLLARLLARLLTRLLARPNGLATLALATLLAIAPITLRAELATVVAQAAAQRAPLAFDGVVEALRQTVVAAQVPGAVMQLDVKVGDRVSAGQLLLRLDARAAEHTAAAGEAQVQAGRAALEAATRDLERQRQLLQRQFISQAAFDQAESTFKATQAQANAQIAQAGASRTQSGFYLVRAPFAGVVSELPVALGDMAMPGRPLLTLYDPTALRVTAALPQGVTEQLAPGQLPRIELPGLPAARRWVQALRMQLLPTVDSAPHTVQLRAELPPGLVGAAPGLHARLWLPLSAGPATPTASALSVPLSAVWRRAELTAVYVLDAAGQPLLRQVRLGRADAERVEVLAGLMPGERVAVDPQAAGRVAPAGQRPGEGR